MPLKPDLPQPEAEQQRVGYAIVGLGQLTVEELVPAVRTSEHAHVVAFVTSETEKGLALARAVGLGENDVYTYDDFEKIAERGDVDAVYIVLPNALHREYVERAAKIGKHVLCEKPLGMNADDARAMVQACGNAGVLLMTAYRCQYTPEHWAARDAVQNVKLGKVKLLDSVHVQVEDHPEAWRLKKELAGGGPLVDVGIYCLNTMRFVLGQEPEWVFAALHQPEGDPRFEEVEESLSFMLGFPGGVMANGLTSYGARTTSTLRVLGEKGSLLMDPAFPYVGVSLSLTDEQGELTPSFPTYDQFSREFDHFAQCIRQGKRPWTPGEEGVQDHVVMDAIYESARTGQVVKLKGGQGKDAFRGTAPEVPGRD
ncbi:Gfo/Idh/MocA family oxidoreductase [Deinococcus deserti]|uniref:Putative Glucose-fructose oxidoreductase n=1 Tax=Deinococcus deserti (strain DSM 17065 / CIP 109153 / LMG 22923 / VCD115) TaxID=546414 RepID=C1D1J5_DEIDV|nr:Gfo/Idh/MocA family oxidoreductase [Deinococcus deserti]ACO45719.1 putative Glucose-fructose oxidoreductase [Deinococcus deserti VCD115]